MLESDQLDTSRVTQSHHPLVVVGHVGVGVWVGAEQDPNALYVPPAPLCPAPHCPVGGCAGVLVDLYAGQIAVEWRLRAEA